jgi:ribosomal-protein-alanine N-acetyltransferase
MVARPPVAFVVDRMTVDDLPAVHIIERESFSTPWPAHAYRQELETNRLAHYIVARRGERIVGFAGIWMLVDEAHITTFAVSSAWRRQGVGERLLLAVLDLSRTRGAHEATLEVRPSNIPARRLYEKYGFKLVGVRPHYYTDNNEDALILTTEDLDGPSMRTRIARLRDEVARRPEVEVDDDGQPVNRSDRGPGAGGAEGAGGSEGSGGSGASRGSGADDAEGSGGSGASGRTGAQSSPNSAAGDETFGRRIIRPSRITRKQL